MDRCYYSDCKRPASREGLCTDHRQAMFSGDGPAREAAVKATRRWREEHAGDQPADNAVASDTPGPDHVCRVPHCGEGVQARGLCSMHLCRATTGKDPAAKAEALKYMQPAKQPGGRGNHRGAKQRKAGTGSTATPGIAPAPEAPTKEANAAALRRLAAAAPTKDGHAAALAAMAAGMPGDIEVAISGITIRAARWADLSALPAAVAAIEAAVNASTA